MAHKHKPKSGRDEQLDRELDEVPPRASKALKYVSGGLAAALALAVGIGVLTHKGGREGRVPAPSAAESTPNLAIPAESNAEPAAAQAPAKAESLPPEVKRYLDGEAAALAKQIDAVFPQANYGYAEVLRSTNSSISRSDSEESKGMLVLDTGRTFTGAQAGQTILGANCSDCSERAWAVVPWLFERYGTNLASAEARPVSMDRTYCGAEGSQEHWVNVANVRFKGETYSISIDSTPLERHAGPNLAVLATSDIESTVNVSREPFDADDAARPTYPKGKLYWQVGEGRGDWMGAGELAGMFDKSKRSVAIGRGLQPMAVVDGASGKILVEAGIQEVDGSMQFMYQATEYAPGDENQPPQFGKNVWAKVPLSPGSLAKAQKSLSGTDPAKVLSSLDAAGIKYDFSGTNGMPQDLTGAASASMDLLWRLIEKTPATAAK